MVIVIRVVNCTDLVEYNTIGFSIVHLVSLSKNADVRLVGKMNFVDLAGFLIFIPNSSTLLKI